MVNWPDAAAVTLSPWSPSARQREAAEYLAAGYSGNRTAELTGIPQTNISRWQREPDFADYVSMRTRDLVEAQRPLFDNSISIAQAIYTRALTGEEVDDRTLGLARTLLERALWGQAKPRAAGGGLESQPAGGATG